MQEKVQILDLSEQEKLRREKLAALRSKEAVAFPNDFRRNAFAADLHAAHQSKSTEVLQAESITVKVSGRIMTRRIMGKAAFVTIQDGTARIQIYLKTDEVGETTYEAFKEWDLGDIVGAEGVLFKTHTNELTVRAQTIRLLVKSLRPLPDKYHGLEDPELRYRQRYLDLMTNEKTRWIFETRAQVVDEIRTFLKERRFLEVETPMMQSIPGGAAARPFITHHNALDIPLYLRIAPELYLKRLVVGGFERVFEINRNFRNEGVSTSHNPEFTMLEFYQAYSDYNELMDLTEVLFRLLGQRVTGSEQIPYQGETIDFAPKFQRLTIVEAVKQYSPELYSDKLSSKEVFEIFERTVEDKLVQPTFITHYPTIVSPLSRPNDQNPEVVDRFELFVGGMEVANGFSELNDPELQAERFRQQVEAKKKGDEEAMFYDADYVKALEYGLPPTAGEGIGIDRLVMLLTDSASIREVLLFPLLKPL